MPRLAEYPLLVITMFVSGLAMFVPATLALNLNLHTESRSFFYIGLIVILLSVFAAIATRKRASAYTSVGQLLGIMLTFIILPIIHAAPVYEITPGMSMLDAYVEFISCITTTGIQVHAWPGDYSGPVQFWRAEVAWLGGLLFWIAAISVFRPLGLGSLGEGLGTPKTGTPSGLRNRGRFTPDLIQKGVMLAVPLYLSATTILWCLLILVGIKPFEAAMLAMSTLSTSGIVPQGPHISIQTTLAAELAMFVFLFLALTKMFLTGRRREMVPRAVLHDTELGLVFILVPCALFLIIAFDWHVLVRGYNTGDLDLMLRSIWGILFTSVSFLTTSGMTSMHWPATGGLGFPEFVLMLLALIGGGAATTAGGIKLLRVYLIYRSCRKEVERMLYPSMVLKQGMRLDRSIPASAGEAWIFIILFLFTLAAVQLMLTMTGLDFSTSFVLAITALSTTGPLADTVLGVQNMLVTVPPAAKLVTGFAMVIGRVELVVFVYLAGQILLR